MPRACLRKTLLSHHQASLSMPNRMKNYTIEFPKQCESKEFPADMCEGSYALESSFAGARLGGEMLDSDVGMHKAIASKIFVPHRKSQPIKSHFIVALVVIKWEGTGLSWKMPSKMYFDLKPRKRCVKVSIFPCECHFIRD